MWKQVDKFSMTAERIIIIKYLIYDLRDKLNTAAEDETMKSFNVMGKKTQGLMLRNILLPTTSQN